jgi:hypothetical protein
MIIYNVTIKVEKEVANEWLDWLKNEHIPDLLGTGCFLNATILQLLDTDDSEGPTYAVQYFADSREEVERYLNDYSAAMRAKGLERWGGKFIAFRSLMKVIN